MNTENLVRTLGDNSVFGAKSGAAFQVDTVADLKAVNVKLMADGQVVEVLGYYEANDCGGGLFEYAIGNAEADNGGTIIAPTSGGGRWLRVWTGVIDARWFGAKLDGVQDDTDFVQAAYNALPEGADSALGNGGGLYIPSGQCRITKQLDFSDNRNANIFGDGMGATQIIVDSATALGVSPFYGAIKASTLLSGWKRYFGFEIRRTESPDSAIANDNGIVMGPVQNLVTIDNVSIQFMGGDAIYHRGESATVNIINCSLRENKFGLAINAIGTYAPIQNLTVAGCSIYGNNGGIKVSSSYAVALNDNDIEGGTPAYPMIDVEANNVWLSGNTCGLYAAATATDCVKINGVNIVVIAGSFSLQGTSGQTCIRIGASARKVIFVGPQISTPNGTNTGIYVTAGASDTVILSPSFSGTFGTEIDDHGTNTSYLTGGSFTQLNRIVLAGQGALVAGAIFSDAGGGVVHVIKTGSAYDWALVDLSGNNVAVVPTTTRKFKPYNFAIEHCLEYADNAAALAAGLVAGDVYRTVDALKIVH